MNDHFIMWKKKKKTLTKIQYLFMIKTFNK